MMYAEQLFLRARVGLLLTMNNIEPNKVLPWLKRLTLAGFGISFHHEAAEVKDECMVIVAHTQAEKNANPANSMPSLAGMS